MAAALSSSITVLTPEVLDLAASKGLSQTSTPFVSFNGLRSFGTKSAAASVGKRQASHSVVVKAATTVAPQFTTLKPLADRILVKITSVEEKTVGGILLPTAAQTKPQGGEVVAVGAGRQVGDKQIAISIEAGSKIVYTKYAGTEIDFNGESHLLLKEDDVIGLLTTDDVQDLKPLNDRVLIKVKEAEGKTAGGVLLTDSAKEKPVIGIVAAVGPGPIQEDGSRKAPEIAPGSTVLYSKFAGTEFKSKDGSIYVVLRTTDVMAVLS